MLNKVSAGIAADFVPPNIATGVERRGGFNGQRRPFLLDVGVAIAGEGDGAAEIQTVLEFEIELAVARDVEESVHGVGEEAQEHGAER